MDSGDDAAPGGFGSDAGLGALAALLADAGVAIAAVDVRGRLQMLSPAYQRMLDRQFEPVSADEMADTFHVCGPDGRALAPDELPIVRAFRGEAVHHEVLTIKVPGQPERYLRTSAVPMLTRHGDRNGAWAVSTDVTAIVAAARGEPPDQALETVNHHLRTPLATVLGYAELLADRDDLPDDVVAAVAAIHRAAERLDAVVDWISDLVAAHAGANQAALDPAAPDQPRPDEEGSGDPSSGRRD